MYIISETILRTIKEILSGWFLTKRLVNKQEHDQPEPLKSMFLYAGVYYTLITVKLPASR